MRDKLPLSKIQGFGRVRAGTSFEAVKLALGPIRKHKLYPCNVVAITGSPDFQLRDRGTITACGRTELHPGRSAAFSMSKLLH